MSKIEKVYEVVRIKQVIIETEESFTVRSPEDEAQVVSQYIGDEDREVLFLLCLNTKNDVIAVHCCHVGSLNASVVHPRELFKTAILNKCSIDYNCHDE